MSKATCGACMKPYDLSRQSQMCPHPKRSPGTQTTRLVEYLRSHPGASGMEIIAALALPKYTSRISDARAAGYNVVCLTRSDGRKGYRVIEAEVVQDVLFFAEIGV